MDYSKSGGAKTQKDAPKHAEHNVKGSNANPFGGDKAQGKAALLARMKAAAQAKKK